VEVKAYITDWLRMFGMTEETAAVLAGAVMVVVVALLSFVGNWLAKHLVHRVFAGLILRNSVKWDDIILERKVFQKLSHIVPAVIIYSFAPVFPTAQEFIEKAAVVYLIIAGTAVINAALNAFDDIYRTFEVSKEKPIKGFIQVLKIVLFTVSAILIVANLIDQSPLILLSGLGALSAVLMVVFKDSLLGLVAGVQLTTNDMVRVGDWIEMPKYNADGDVIEISLNTVKVRNWDKTITTIPSYALISDSFKNWRGMHSSGGRRIKRAIYIDTSSIRFCTPEMIEKFRKIHLLKDYIERKEREIEAYNEENGIDSSVVVNGRRMTNIGCFRAYIENYLRHHPHIHKEMTMMVRQLAPGEHGLPLEIYAFTNGTVWTFYEGVQSDIFDHIFAVAPEFGLRVFQNPTGYDLQRLIDAERAAAVSARSEEAQAAAQAAAARAAAES